MEKYYDGDQESFFKEAHVINPFNKPNIITKPKVAPTSNDKEIFREIYVFRFIQSLQAKKSGTEECEICFSFFPPSVSIRIIERSSVNNQW